MRHTPIPGPAPMSADWFALRTWNPDREPHCVFGASEAAALCGLSNYLSTYELYLRKRGLIVEPEETEAMAFGKALESAILTEYARRNGYSLLPGGMWLHPKYPFISATPDAMACRSNTEEAWPVDAKNTGVQRFKADFGEEGTDDLPMDILMQAQQQMLVMGTPMQETPVLVGGNRLKVFRVQRNEDLCNGIIEAAVEMYDRLKRCDPPDPDFSHPGGLVGVMKKAFKLDPSESVFFGEDMEHKWAEYQRKGEEIKELEAERDEIKAEVLHRMGDAGVARFADAAIELVRQPRHRASYVVKESNYVVLMQRKVKR